MVEKKDFAIIFRKENISDEIEEFIPIRVIEGKYDKENKWFTDTDDNLQYIHINIVPDHVVGYACRTSIELMKESISEKTIEQIKKEILSYAEQFKYRRRVSVSDCIVAINKENGNEYLFEDLDTMEEYTLEEVVEVEVDETLGMTPKEIEEEIKKTIKGQDEAIRQIVTALWTTIKFRKMRKKNMLIIGPSGVGKTAIFEKIQEILDIPVVIFSVPGLSQAGYVGRSTDEILKQIYNEADQDIALAERSIVILDELDKIAERGEGGISTTGVQNELLKIIEGCTRYVDSESMHEPDFTIDTSKIIFVATGAFQELYEKEKEPIGFNSTNQSKEKKKITQEKLINYGLKRELVGRLPIKVELNALNKEILKEIIIDSDESELKTTIEALNSLNVKIANIEELIDLIAEDALNNKLGARGLIPTINNIFHEIFYEVANNPNKYSKVIIGPNIIKDHKDFKLIKKKNYTRKRT